MAKTSVVRTAAAPFCVLIATAAGVVAAAPAAAIPAGEKGTFSSAKIAGPHLAIEEAPKRPAPPAFRLGDKAWCRNQETTVDDTSQEDIKVVRVLDFDGDGKLDCSLTTPNNCGSGGCTYYHYVMKGECGIYVGHSQGIDAWEPPRRGDGWISSFTASHGSGCKQTEHFRSRLRKGKYEVTECRECSRDEQCLSDSWECAPWRPCKDPWNVP
jgi:hypothetical protein